MTDASIDPMSMSLDAIIAKKKTKINSANGGKSRGRGGRGGRGRVRPVGGRGPTVVATTGRKNSFPISNRIGRGGSRPRGGLVGGNGFNNNQRGGIQAQGVSSTGKKKIKAIVQSTRPTPYSRSVTPKSQKSSNHPTSARQVTKVKSKHPESVKPAGKLFTGVLVEIDPLNPDINEGDISELCETFGEIKNVRLMRSKLVERTGGGFKRAEVRFRRKQDAEKAVKRLHKRALDDTVMYVSIKH